MLEQNSSFIVRAWIAIAALLLFGIVFAPSRASAQAADGPQSGATPSDQPASTPQHSVPQIGGHPSLAGTWTLNKDQSDDPRQKMREAMGGGGGNGNGNGGGGGFGGGGGRGMGGGGGRRGGGGGQGGMNAEFSQLTIVQTATSAKVTGSSGRVLAQYSSDSSSPSANSAAANNSNSSDADNSADSGPGANANQGPAPAQWQGSQLVATLQGRRGGSTSRTYELSPDGSQLYVITKIDNSRLQQPITFRFVYDAANSNGGANQ